MSFLQPMILLGLPLIALPVIIHLVNRMRHTPMYWGAMQFLVKARQHSTRSAKLRQLLILACRVGVLLFLILALARPLAGGWVGWWFSGPPETVVILLDRSASMDTLVQGGQKSRREMAIEQIIDAGEKLGGRPAFVLIDSAGGKPRRLPDLELLRDSTFAESTDTAADFGAMFQNALEFLIADQTGNAEIWVASDLQTSNWRPDRNIWQEHKRKFAALKQRVVCRVLAVGQSGADNHSVQVKDVESYTIDGQRELDIAFLIRRQDQSRKIMPLTVNMNGVLLHEDVELTGPETLIHYRVPIEQDSMSGIGYVEIPADRNTRDDRSYFAYSVRHELRAAVVSESEQVGRLAALAIAPEFAETGPSCDVLAPDQTRALDLATAALVVWHAPLPEPPAAKLLEGFVSKGGVVLFLPPGENDNVFQGYRWGTLENAAADRTFQISTWARDTGPLADTMSGKMLPVDFLNVKKRRAVSGPLQVLSSYDGGQLFLGRGVIGDGRVYFLTTLPHREWSDLYQGLVLVPMMQRLLREGARRFRNVVTVPCGAPTDLQRENLDAIDGFSGDGETPFAAGVYRRGDGGHAVFNRPEAEDLGGQLAEGDVERLLPGEHIAYVKKADVEEESLQAEIWHAFVVTVLVLFLVEGLMTLTAPLRKERETK